jgi:oligosaccharide repeat unit polymerase
MEVEARPRVAGLRVFLKRWVLGQLAGIGIFALLLWGRPDILFELIFLSFIPYVLWRARVRTGAIDAFSPEVGFPTLFVIYMLIGTITLPIESQFGLVLPWTQWVYYIIALLAYLFGVRLMRNSKGSPRTPLKNLKLWRDHRFFLAVGAILLIGFAARMINVSRFGIPILNPEVEELRVKYVSGVAGALALGLEAAFLCLLLYLLVGRARSRARYLVISIMAVIFLDSLVSGDRGGLLRMGVAGLVIAHYVRRKLNLKSLMIAGSAVLIIVSAIGSYREYSVFGAAHNIDLENHGFNSYTYSLASAYYVLRHPPENFYLLTQYIPKHDSYRYGAVSLSVMTEFLPGHQPGPGQLVQKVLRQDFVGFGAATTMLGPLYVDGGVFAIVLGMVLFGMLAKYLHNRMTQVVDYRWVLIYAWFMQNQFKAIKDEILPDLGVLWVIVLFVFVYWFAGTSLHVYDKPAFSAGRLQGSEA